MATAVPTNIKQAMQICCTNFVLYVTLLSLARTLILMLRNTDDISDLEVDIGMYQLIWETNDKNW